MAFFAWSLLLWRLTESWICCSELYVFVRCFISNNCTLQDLTTYPWKFSSRIWGWITSAVTFYCQRMCLAVFEHRGVCWPSPQDFAHIRALIDEPCAQVTFTQLNRPWEVFSGSGLSHSSHFNPQWQCRIWSSSPSLPRGFDRSICAHV